MTKRKIRVVKHDAPPPPAPADDQEVTVDTDRELANSVKGWITERRKNSIAERESDERQVFTREDTRDKTV